jgi:hypothetical protein
MSFFRRSALALLSLAAFSLSARAGEIGPFTGPEADAEAARLAERANAYVNNVVEDLYSYAYVQFHWKRAGANIDRILRAYPSSPTAAQLRAGTLKLGPFTPPYFKERVLPRLEEKKVAAFDAVNCAIFLYNLPENRDAAGKQALLASIVQTLCRQIRWSEALSFPVLDNERPWLWNEVIRQAAIYRNDKLVDELLANIVAAEKPMLLATVAEGLAFRGETPTALEAFLKKQGDTPALRTAIFTGLLRRELEIQRAVAANRPLKGLYSGVDGIQLAEQSADLPAWLKTIPAGPALDEARRLHAGYLAALGRLDEARALLPRAEHAGLALRYASYLVSTGEFTAAENLPATFGLTPAQTTEFNLGLLELLAKTGADQPAASVRARVMNQDAVATAFREFHGRMLSTEKQLIVRTRTFVDLPIKDPNLIGRLVCEWSLTPNRTIRGAVPWDAIVFKFAPGFENLSPPKDKRKIEAAGR